MYINTLAPNRKAENYPTKPAEIESVAYTHP